MEKTSGGDTLLCDKQRCRTEEDRRLPLGRRDSRRTSRTVSLKDQLARRVSSLRTNHIATLKDHVRQLRQLWAKGQLREDRDPVS